jgi:hypothetical protein
MARVWCEAGIKCLSCTEKQEGPTLVARKCGHEFHISLRSEVRRHRDTKRQSGLPNLLLALSVSTTSAYSNLGVLQGFEPPTSATNSISLPLSHINQQNSRCQTRSFHWMSCCHADYAQESHRNICLLGVPLPHVPPLLRLAGHFHGESMRRRLPLICPHWTCFGPSLLGGVSADSLFSWGSLASSGGYKAVRQRLGWLPMTVRLPLYSSSWYGCHLTPSLRWHP